MLAGTLGIPEPSVLPLPADADFLDDTINQPVPYFFVGDDAFSLEANMMKPYSQRNLTEDQRILNYRFSRARRISENVFGILSSRFRVFLSILCVKPDSAVDIVMAALALHNYLRSNVPGRYTSSGTIDTEDDNGMVEGTWRNEINQNPFPLLPNFKKGKQTQRAEGVRDQLRRYVNGPGQVPWQWKVLL